MKFVLIDRIVELSRGERIVADKAVTLTEEYLADHFPDFPVLPGVLMLETMVEAAAWLVRDAQDFRSPVILLRYAKNVTYKNFVKPGNILRVSVTCRQMSSGESDFSGVGHCRDEEVVRARFGLTHRGLGEDGHGPTPVEQELAEAGRANLIRLRC